MLFITHNVVIISSVCTVVVSEYVNVLFSLQTFESPLNFHHADVGRCVAAELFNVTEVDGTAATVTTTDVPSFTVELTHPTTTTPAGPTQVRTTMAQENWEIVTVNQSVFYTTV